MTVYLAFKRRATPWRLITAALLTLLPLMAPAQQPSKAITGRVITPAGEPFVGGAIYAVQIGSITQVQPVKTDSGGNFRIDNLEGGLYRVWASMPGFVPSNQPSTPAESGYYRPGDSLTLTMAKGGVITGTVNGPSAPAVGTLVRAIRLRDGDGKPLDTPAVLGQRSTDDRGIYRIYGLPPGVYLVAAGGLPPFGGMMIPSAFDADAYTYFPSAARDTALELVVRSGEEVTADIQLRSESGRAISGTVTGVAESTNQFGAGVTLSLTNVHDRSTLLNASANSYTNYAFALYGVPDGEYELIALQRLPGGDILRSEPLRIRMRGADVTSLRPALVSQAGIEGRLVLEKDPKAECGKRRETATQETLILARRYEPEIKLGEARDSTLADVSILAKNLVAIGIPDAKGSFTLRNLAAGSYRVEPRAPGSGWYIRSIGVGPTQSVAARNATARDGVRLKSGERLSGLTVTITEGAASVRGRVTAPEGKQIPSSVRVYFVPVEKESVADVLRFFEAQTESDGTFVIGNIAPGKYWLVARQTDERDLNSTKLIRRDLALRSLVLQEAEKSKIELALKPCERKTDYELVYLSTDRPE